MARETDTTRLPGASEYRIIECPVCSSAMTTMEAEGVTVDVCAGGCSGIWFDWFELARVDEVHESAGEKFLEVERDPTLRPDLSKRIRCPRDGEIMMCHFHSVKRGVLVDECPRCAGFWLDAGELAGIRNEFATQEERKQAAQEYFSELFDPDLAVERAKTMEDLRKARRIAYAFRFICPSYYIPVSRTGGRSEAISFQLIAHESMPVPLLGSRTTVDGPSPFPAEAAEFRDAKGATMEAHIPTAFADTGRLPPEFIRGCP